MEDSFKMNNWFNFGILVLFSINFADNSFAEEDEYIEVIEAKDHLEYWVAKKLPNPKLKSNQARESNGGCVSVAMIIDTNGNTSNLKLVGSFPDNALDEAAIDMFSRAHFEPAKSNQDRKPIFTVFTWNAVPSVSINNRKKNDNDELAKKVSEICHRKVDDYLAQLILRAAE